MSLWRFLFGLMVTLLLFSPWGWSEEGKESKRDLEQFKKNRTYDGAPPVIPHEVDVKKLEKTNCLSCHLYGGYSPKLGKNTPKTPHPELKICRQCHVPQNVQELFKPSDFERWANEIKKQEKTLPSAPPVIPHDPQMRQNCQSCHTGPGAVSELKSTHPQRKMCRQCHVFQQKSEKFNRP